MAHARETASTLGVRPLVGAVTPIPPGDELRAPGGVGGLVLHLGGRAAVAEQVGALVDDLAGVQYAHRSCLADALGVLHTRDDIACVLFELADASTLATLEALLGGRPDAPPVIVLVSGDEYELAQRARRSGVDDVVFERELGGSELARAITYAIERR